jgi:hypothetical protein
LLIVSPGLLDHPVDGFALLAVAGSHFLHLESSEIDKLAISVTHRLDLHQQDVLLDPKQVVSALVEPEQRGIHALHYLLVEGILCAFHLVALSFSGQTRKIYWQAKHHAQLKSAQREEVKA